MENFVFIFGIVALITNVVSLRGIVFAQINNNLSEIFDDNNEIGIRIFGFEESTDGCMRNAKTEKEKKIGITFNLLCQHFGPIGRSEILKSVKMQKKNVSRRMMKRVFIYCLDKMKLRIISCFETIFDNYDLAGTEIPPKCLKNLAIFPNEKLQMFWLKKFSFILNYINRVIEGYKIFNPSRIIVEKYLNQGILQRWKQIPYFQYAKTKIKEWNSSEFENLEDRLEIIIGDSSNLFNICMFSDKWLKNIKNFEDNICLQKILGNILILETHLQKYGVTLETEFIFGRYILLHLLHVVKSVIRLHNIVPSRKSLNVESNPVSDMISQLNEIKVVNVKCLDNLRQMYDANGGGKLSNVLKNQQVQKCLNKFLNKTESLSESAKKAYLRQVHAPEKVDVKTSEKMMIKSVMKCHKQMKPIQPVIQDMVDRGIPKPSPEYPWANKFLRTFKSSSIANNNAKLSNAHFSSSYSSSSSCKGNSKVSNGKNKCWSNYVTQNMIIEKDLQDKGLTLQQLYVGEPRRMNMVYYIDQALKKNKRDKNRIIVQYRKSLGPSVDTDEILEEAMAKVFGNTTIDDSLSHDYIDL